MLLGFIAAAMTFTWLNRRDPENLEDRIESSHSPLETVALDLATESNPVTSAELNSIELGVADYPSAAATASEYESESADEEWSAYVESVIVRHISASGIALISYHFECRDPTCRVLLVPATSKHEPSELAPIWGRIRSIATEIVANSNGALQSVSIRAHTNPSQREQGVEILFNRRGQQSTFTIDMPSRTAISPACSSLPAQFAIECVAREGQQLRDSGEPQVIVIE